MSLWLRSVSILSLYVCHQIDNAQMYGLYMITQLAPDLEGDERSDTLQALRLKLSNPAIAEIHFLQQDEDLTVFPDDIIRHPKFHFTVVGSTLSFAHVVEYGSRVLTGNFCDAVNPSLLCRVVANTFSCRLSHYLCASRRNNGCFTFPFC